MKNEQPQNIALVDHFRTLVKDSIQNNQLKAAKFYGDKLLSLTARDENPSRSKYDSEDVLLYAQVFYLSQEYRRAIHVLSQYRMMHYETPSINATQDMMTTLGGCTKNYHNSEDVPPLDSCLETKCRFHLLEGQCLAASHQWEECLELVSKVSDDSGQGIKRLARTNSTTSTCSSTFSSVLAQLSLLRGEAYEALENRELASKWYQLALECDATCATAFFHLVEKHLLSHAQERTFLEGLRFTPTTEYLKSLYGCHVGKVGSTTPRAHQDQVDRLENDFGLIDNLDVMIASAEMYFYQHDIERAYEISKRIQELDPLNYECIPIYISTMVGLHKKSELFYCGHSLVEAYPDKAVSWFAVACYYFSIHKYDYAQRYFHKSTSLDPNFAPAWIGFGHAFAAQDESDQAMTSYRTASRLFPGSHLPRLCIGMEYLRTNHLPLAIQFIQQAQDICPDDPLIDNELGVLYYQQREFDQAKAAFLRALARTPKTTKTPKTKNPHFSPSSRHLAEVVEPCLVNLAHVYRKSGELCEATTCLERALMICPTRASTHSALGLTVHLQGHVDRAIRHYHTALSMKPDDTLASELLCRALAEHVESSSFELQRESRGIIRESHDEKVDYLDSMDRSSMMNISSSKSSSIEMDEDMSL